LWAFLALVLVATPALADDAATAEALFREGRAAMARSDYEEAARRFAESDRLQPAPGTRLNLALAESHTGRLAAAWEHARAARDELSSTDERFAVAQKLYESLDQRVPRLTLRSSSALPPGSHILLDGTELREGSLGVALPQNVGKHSVVIAAPGHADMPLEVTVKEGEREVLEVRVGAAQLGTPEVKAKPIESPGSSPLKPIGITATVVGGASVLGGLVFGGLALDRNAIVSDPAHCDARGCDDAGVNAARAGRTYTTVASIGIVSGILLLATGIALWALAPAHK
jgi:hypothetical protein